MVSPLDIKLHLIAEDLLRQGFQSESFQLPPLFTYHFHEHVIRLVLRHAFRHASGKRQEAPWGWLRLLTRGVSELTIFIRRCTSM